MTLAALLALALVGSPPLECPKGSERRGASPPDDYEVWCDGKDPYGQPRREGPSRTWYDDGSPWVERGFHEGILDGPFRERHRNGKVAREGTYAMGNKVGSWRIYYESGAPEEESEWREGVPHGRFVSYWPSGAIRASGRHCGGAQCGRWKTFDAQGKPLGEVDYGEQRLSP